METPKTFNEWADYWRYTIGVNVIPADTKHKRTSIPWKQYQDAPIPLEQHEQWKAEDAFRNGMAIIAGKVWHNHAKKGLYLAFVDLDNLRAIDEFAKTGLEQLAQHVIVEQHKDDRSKAHVYFYTTKPLPKKSSDKTDPKLAQKLLNDEIPAIEVKGLGEHGIAYCAPSLHKNNHPYEILGTLEPTIVDDFKDHIESICKKYGIQYLEATNGTDRALTPISEMFKQGFVVLEGHNRHEALLRVMESLLARNIAILDMDSIKRIASEWNQAHCRPPLEDTDFERQWHYATNFIKKNPPAMPSSQHKGTVVDSSKNEKETTTGQDGEEEKSEALALTEQVLQQYIIRCTGQKQKLMIYRNGWYDEKDAEPTVAAYLESISPNISTKMVSEVIGKIKRLTYVNESLFDADPHMINFENCWYNWLEDKTYPHDPERLSIHQLPYPYPEKKIAPKHFGKFIHEIHYPKEIRTAIEWMAYTFMRQNKFELVCFKIGYGKNGKTTEDNLMRALHGCQIMNGSILGGAVTGFAHKQIKESRFATYRMRRAALNIDAETDDHAIDMTELKRLASRDTLQEVEGKGIDFQTVALQTKFQMNFNKDPVIVNQSDGDIRRLVMLSYPNQFEGKKEDVNLDQKLQNKEELSAIFACAIAPALRRLHKAKTLFMEEATIDQRRIRYEMITDPLKAATSSIFVQDSTVDDYALKSDTYKAYVKFCEKNNLAVLSIRKFSEYIKTEIKPNEGKRGPRGQQAEAWIGVRLNPTYTVMNEQTQLTQA